MVEEEEVASVAPVATPAAVAITRTGEISPAVIFRLAVRIQVAASSRPGEIFPPAAKCPDTHGATHSRGVTGAIDPAGTRMAAY